MTSGFLKDVLKRLETNEPEAIEQCLNEIQTLLPNADDQETADLVGAVNAVFYYDTYEYPHLQPVVNHAVKTLSAAGERVIPHLLRLLGDSDYKVEFHYALIFGQIGAAAVAPLLQAYDVARDSTERSFIIYSLGKIKSPALKQATALVLTELGSSSKEVRDSAARTMGKIVENVSVTDVAPQLRSQICARLIAALRDTHSGVRAKACRSLGKMAKRGWLDKTEIDILSREIAHLLGKDSQRWDDAFAVRKEAAEVEETLTRLR
jgi:HEAT repeat protein